MSQPLIEMRLLNFADLLKMSHFIFSPPITDIEIFAAFGGEAGESTESSRSHLWALTP